MGRVARHLLGRLMSNDEPAASTLIGLVVDQEIPRTGDASVKPVDALYQLCTIALALPRLRRPTTHRESNHGHETPGP